MIHALWVVFTIIGWIAITLSLIPAVIKFVDFSLGTWRRWIAEWRGEAGSE